MTINESRRWELIFKQLRGQLSIDDSMELDKLQTEVLKKTKLNGGVRKLKRFELTDEEYQERN